MARMVRAVFLGLSAVALLFWIGGYLYISGLACAFSGPGPCAFRLPWQLHGEDLLILVAVPGAVIGLLLLAAFGAHLRVTATQPDRDQ